LVFCKWVWVLFLKVGMLSVLSSLLTLYLNLYLKSLSWCVLSDIWISWSYTNGSVISKLKTHSGHHPLLPFLSICLYKWELQEQLGILTFTVPLTEILKNMSKLSY
jgi:hypothetical protein